MLRIFFCTFAVIFLCVSSSVVSSETGNPDIILITIDTLRADHLGCYGYKGGTSPTIDSIARTALLFESAFATAPLTLPSHTSILTGMYPVSHGLRDNAFFPKLKYPLLAQILKQRHYATAAFVSGAPLASKFGLSAGFDNYDDFFAGVERKADATTDRALKWWNEAKTRPRFMWVHYFDPHSDYNPPAPYKDTFSKNLYDGEIAFVDHELARLRAVAPNAILAITADHGESLGEHGESTHGVFLYNATLHVPLILRVPGLPPERRKEPATLCDLLPTILDLLKISQLKNLPGNSLLKTNSPRTLFAESLYAQRNFGYSSLFAVIEENQKYIQSPVPELYNLFRDPNETKNLATTLDVEKWKRSIQEYARQSVNQRAVQMSAEDQEKLRSLGYVGGSLPENSIDPKSKIRMIEEFNSGMTLLKLEKYQEAQKRFESVTQTEPRNSLGFRFLADALAAQKKYGEAKLAYSTSFKLRPDVEVSVQLAKTYSRLGELSLAEKVLQNAIHDYPDYQDARFELASLYSSQNRYEEAFALLDQQDPTYHNQKGILYLRKNEFASAVQEFEEALREEEKPIYWNNAGIAYSKLKRFDDARRAFENALSKDPDYLECEVNLAVLLLEAGKYEEALRYLKPVTTQNPNLLQPRFMLGFALERTGNPQQALQIYKDLLAIVPPDWPQKEQLTKRIEELSNSNP